MRTVKPTWDEDSAERDCQVVDNNDTIGALEAVAKELEKFGLEVVIVVRGQVRTGLGSRRK